MKNEMLKIEDIHPYENNPKCNDNAVQAVANSIKKFGFNVPIVVDKDHVIITGHTRYLASKKLGYKEIPCIIADDLDETKAREFRLVDNKVAQLAEWDLTVLGEELKMLKEFDFEDFGFNDIELMMLTEDIEPEPYDNNALREYSENAKENILKCKSLILKYRNDFEKSWIESTFGLENLKVVYKCDDLINMEG